MTIRFGVRTYSADLQIEPKETSFGREIANITFLQQP